jgi:hypothetical protein
LPKRYNLFIDAQNVPARYIDSIIHYCQSTGYVQEEARLYASPNEIITILARTKTLLAENDIDAVPIPCKRGKNSVDIALAVDVIEGACEDSDDDVFIIVTNDSDFTHVASRVISYKSEFHLLYTGKNKPSGYSPKAKLHRLEPPASSAKGLGSNLRNAVKALPVKRGAQRLIGAVKGASSAPYSATTPLKDLARDHFAKRIADCSPVAIHSKSLFAAYKELTGQRWKSIRSKKSAEEFAEEFFGGRRYRFVRNENATPNVGYFVSENVSEFLVSAPEGNEFYCLAGAEEDVLSRQAGALANALSERDHANFEGLYEACAERNVMPRYGAWALLRAWFQATGVPKAQQNRERALPRREVSQADILDGFRAEMRRQTEEGELAFVMAPGGSACAA